MSARIENTRIYTFTGSIDLLDPRPEDVCIEDIAHGLMGEPRFNCATRDPYVVAQHSWYASHLVPREDALAALLHDGPEAYIKDLPRPLKNLLRSVYGPIEAAFWRAIAQRFDLSLELPQSVKDVDRVLLATEIRDLIRPSDLRDAQLRALPSPLTGEIVPVAPARAEQLFVERFYELQRERRARYWDVLG